MERDVNLCALKASVRIARKGPRGILVYLYVEHINKGFLIPHSVDSHTVSHLAISERRTKFSLLFTLLI